MLTIYFISDITGRAEQVALTSADGQAIAARWQKTGETTIRDNALGIGVYRVFVD